ncbi:hypothetical protein Vadar_019721 [Vaccinium darrowii]|uniref:Uncharacterized protein n=1 Tax=Vaccinium darrowii TaxID=229202 RepID=A0ACB7XSF2_9ERIC|nr:hypothetical protein Vadar_019721 [Vaccinium darrowii]
MSSAITHQLSCFLPINRRLHLLARSAPCPALRSKEGFTWFYILLTCSKTDHQLMDFILSGLPCSCGETKIMNVGEELWKETIPLQMGSRLYQLEGLKSNTSYQVKISYPASIPSRFSLLLTRGNSSLVQNWKRKLLNTEKLIFKTGNLELSSDEGEMCVLVTVEPEGVVAIPNVEERKEVIFNIVCDELLLFIPQYAWWVIVIHSPVCDELLLFILVVLCLGLAAAIPHFLPSHFIRTKRSPQSASQITSKDS